MYYIINFIFVFIISFFKLQMWSFILLTIYILSLLYVCKNKLDLKEKIQFIKKVCLLIFKFAIVYLGPNTSAQQINFLIDFLLENGLEDELENKSWFTDEQWRYIKIGCWVGGFGVAAIIIYVLSGGGNVPPPISTETRPVPITISQPVKISQPIEVAVPTPIINPVVGATVGVSAVAATAAIVNEVVSSQTQPEVVTQDNIELYDKQIDQVMKRARIEEIVDNIVRTYDLNAAEKILKTEYKMTEPIYYRFLRLSQGDFVQIFTNLNGKPFVCTITHREYDYYTQQEMANEGSKFIKYDITSYKDPRGKQAQRILSSLLLYTIKNKGLKV